MPFFSSYCVSLPIFMDIPLETLLARKEGANLINCKLSTTRFKSTIAVGPGYTIYKSKFSLFILTRRAGQGAHDSSEDCKA